MATSAQGPDGLRSVSAIRTERRESLHERFGGFSWGADFLGFAVAIFFVVVLFGIVSAIVGTVGYQMGAPVPKAGSISGTTETLGLAGLIGGLVAVFISYLLGGYAAGRMARFDGALNGLGVVIWTIVIAIVLGIIGAILGNRFDVARQLDLHVSASTMTAAGAISLIVTLVVMVLSAVLGGKIGAAYHRRIDREVEAMS